LAEVLARTLASVVTAKVEGLLGDVRIAGPARKDLGVVANHAGCALIEAENETDWLGLAFQAARGPDVFLLRCGRAPEAGFIEEAADFWRQTSRINGARRAQQKAAWRDQAGERRGGRENPFDDIFRRQARSCKQETNQPIRRARV
jgi:hypothetical protein